METVKTATPWLTYPEAEKYTGLERTTLYRAARRGELRVGGISHAPRFHRDDLDSWLRSGSTGRA